MSNTITINNHIYQAKGSVAFSRTAKLYAGKTEHKGKEVESDGVVSIFMGLLQQDVEKLIAFWHCATSHEKNNQLTPEQIEDYFMEEIDKGTDMLDYFKSALEVLNEGGYFKGKMRTYWFMMNTSAKAKSKEEKEESLAQVTMFKDLYQEITGKAPYEIIK
ncbi:tail assembly chaperone [Macrococcus animalis]|uniref:tail assembly chaperone n=1 Tax=Macrococcus animalis TaxID=3395467 RepID=UPI0039BE88C1